MFLPLAAAAAGAATTLALGGGTLAMTLPAYTDPRITDIPLAAIIAVVGAAFGVAGAWVFPAVHRAFHAIRWPIVMTTLGGALLGLLGVLGGSLTLFKGLEQSGELLANLDTFGVPALLGILFVKMAALIVSASAGFRGGRIFPAVFIGVALGALAVAIVPETPLGLAIGCGVLGLTLAVGRDGWLALFIAVIVAGDIALLPLLCLALLPAWLVVTRAPRFLVARRRSGPEPTAAGASPS
jgi:H+/Cl- antiporter ClcA